MKILIWIACIFTFAFIDVAMKDSGVRLGAIPYALLFTGMMAAATALCKAVDKNKADKQESGEEKKIQNVEDSSAPTESMAELTIIQTEPVKPLSVSEIYAEADKYYYGKEVSRDYRKAMEYYQKAADAGHVDAMKSIGYLYQNGFGVEKNMQTAMEWYNKAESINGLK